MSRPGVYLNLPGVDGSAQSRVECPCILTVTVAERVIDVLFRTVHCQALFGNLKLLSGITMREEGQNPDQDTDGCCVYSLQAADIDSLRDSL